MNESILNTKIKNIAKAMYDECHKVTVEVNKDEVFSCVVFHVKHNWLTNYEHRISLPFEHVLRYDTKELASMLLRHFFEDLIEYIK